MADFIDLEAVAVRLKKLLERSGMSSKDFALETGIPASSLSQILNGKTTINVDSINKIVDRWQHKEGFDPNWFIFGQPTSSILDEHFSLDASQDRSDEYLSLQAALIQKTEEIGRLKAILEANQNLKKIDHITVFYSDKSFEIYRLYNIV